MDASLNQPCRVQEDGSMSCKLLLYKGKMQIINDVEKIIKKITKKVQKMFGSLENYALSLHPQNERNTVLRYTRKMRRPETMACGIDRK